VRAAVAIAAARRVVRIAIFVILGLLLGEGFVALQNIR
jgi:hypothetical protein